MKAFFGFICLGVASTFAQDSLPNPSTTAPDAVVASAVQAVRELGEQVVLGRYQYAIDRMNPMWKDRAARRAGGMAALEGQLNQVTREMVRQGISVIDSKPQGVPRAIEVWPGTRRREVDGQTIEEPIYTKWLVFVPTVTTYRVVMEGQPRPMRIESTGFQVAISEKEPLHWSFIDGSSVTINELRSLFITLPSDFVLPPIERREIP